MVYHELVGHFGQEYVLASLLESYWIVKGRATVRRVLGNVLITKEITLFSADEFRPIDRLTPDEPPFTSVGIAFSRPLCVKQRRFTVKHYGCLFSCLTVRSIHIEVTESPDTDSFALRTEICQPQK